MKPNPLSSPILFRTNRNKPDKPCKIHSAFLSAWYHLTKNSPTLGEQYPTMAMPGAYNRDSNAASMVTWGLDQGIGRQLATSLGFCFTGQRKARKPENARVVQKNQELVRNARKKPKKIPLTNYQGCLLHSLNNKWLQGEEWTLNGEGLIKEPTPLSPILNRLMFGAASRCSISPHCSVGASNTALGLFAAGHLSATKFAYCNAPW